MMLIDAHAHLDHYTAETLPAVLDTLAAQRIFTISVAMDPPSYAQAKQIATHSEWVLPTFGVHPWEAPHWADRLSDLDPLIAESPLLGEIGLDTVWVKDPAAFPAQRRVFEHFLAAARDQHKLVNLHTKGAERDVLQLLQHYSISRAIVHWYSGSIRVLRDMIDYGCYFTVGVQVLRSRSIRTIARRIPEDRLLTETDNPGGWEWMTNGEVGQPDVLHDVVRTLAEVRETTEDAIRATVRANLRRLIADDPHLPAVAARLAVDDPV
ncbi:MAG: TatD family hydrolase [Anaerolineae bacterium]|nr:TatD family hydrolase [Anaerolineae bacterium]